MERSASEIIKVDEAEGSETTIEIKVKTLDSQTYTLKVDKQVINFSYLPWISNWLFLVSTNLIVV